MKKLANNDIIDKESIIYLMDADINSIKLSAGDRGKFVAAIAALKLDESKDPSKALEPTPVPDNPENAGASNSDVNQVGVSSGSVVEQKSSFDK